MQITTYIKDLLYRYECVIVPGFGAFLVHSFPVGISKDDHFTPPGRTLTFNRQLQTNDGLLANHVASCKGCSYEAALQQIRFFTRSLVQTLETERRLELDQIGTFTIDEHGLLSFKPSSHNYDRNAFGLTAFTSVQINRLSTLKENDDLPNKGLSRELGEPGAFPWIKYAAVGIIAIALSGIGGFKIYQDQVEQHNFAQREAAGQRLEKEIQQATFVLEDPLPVVEVSVPEIQGKYHVIAGAYRVEANALKKLEELRSKGFPARDLGKNRYGLHQVAYSTHRDRESALRSLRKAKSTENPDAWLLVFDFARR